MLKTDQTNLESVLWKLYVAYGSVPRNTEQDSLNPEKTTPPISTNECSEVPILIGKKGKKGEKASKSVTKISDGERQRHSKSFFRPKSLVSPIGNPSKSPTLHGLKGVNVKSDSDEADRTEAKKREELVEWANFRLKERNFAIPSSRGGAIMCLDLRSGVKLINLAEILMGESVGHYFQEAATKWHMLQNAKQLLAMLTKENDTLPKDVTASGIVDGDPDAIFGLLAFLREKYDFEYAFKWFVILISLIYYDYQVKKHLLYSHFIYYFSFLFLF